MRIEFRFDKGRFFGDEVTFLRLVSFQKKGRATYSGYETALNLNSE